MAITYPRDMPDVPRLLNIEQCSFDIEPLGELSRAASGAIAFQEQVGGSLWQAKYTTIPLNGADYGVWHAWRMSLHGSTYQFRAFDPGRIAPLNYYANGVIALPEFRADGETPFDGTCTVEAAGGETVSLSGLPSGFKFAEGDYLSFRWLNGRVLVKVLTAANASIGGICNNLDIAPWLRAGGNVGNPVQLVRAWCPMRLVPGTWQGERQGYMAPVSFQAIQDPL